MRQPSFSFRFSALLPGLALLAACEGAGPDGAVPALRDSVGVEIRTNTRAARWAPEETWWVETVRTIRSPERPAEAVMGGVQAGALDAEGRIHVLDGTDGRVRVFGPDGDWLRTLGTIGEGPGELSGLSQSVVVRSGEDGEELWIPDAEQRRVVRFTTDGNPLPDLLAEGALSYRSWWQRGGDDQLYRRAVEWESDGAGGWQATDRLDRVRLFDGDVAETGRASLVFEPVTTFSYDRPDLKKTSGPARLYSVTNAPAWTVGPDHRVVWLALDAPQLRFEQPDGPDLWVRSESWVPRPPSGDDERLLERMAEEAFRKRGLIGTDAFEHPQLLPAITDVMVGPDGTVWVQRAGALREAHPPIVFNDALPPGWGGQTWEVLDREGRYLGSVEFPPRFRVLDVRGERILGAQYDLNYEDRIMVLEIQRPGPGA